MSETESLYARIGELEVENEALRRDYQTLNRQFPEFFETLRVLTLNAVTAVKRAGLAADLALVATQNAVVAAQNAKPHLTEVAAKAEAAARAAAEAAGEAAGAAAAAALAIATAAARHAEKAAIVAAQEADQAAKQAAAMAQEATRLVKDGHRA